MLMSYPDSALSIEGFPLLEASVDQIVLQIRGEEDEMCLLFDTFQETYSPGVVLYPHRVNSWKRQEKDFRFRNNIL